MSEMIDRVAEAIGHYSSCAVHNEPAFPNGPCNCGIRERAIDAIKAMREPTEAIVTAGFVAHEKYGDLGFVWQAMIDRALEVE